MNVIYPDPDGNAVWFGGNNGLNRYQTGFNKNYRRDYTAVIRDVLVNGNSLFFDKDNRYKIILRVKMKDREKMLS